MVDEHNKDNTPVRIAQIIGKLSAGGVESVIYNYYRHIDHSRFQFDFFVDADSTCQPLQELVDMGARYFLKALSSYSRDLNPPL